MKRTIRSFFLLIVILGFSGTAQGQCYTPLRQDGIDFRRQDNYRESINRFLAAYNCPDKPSGNDLAQQILQTQDEWVAELERERQKAKAAQAEALTEKQEADRLRQAAELSALRDSLFIVYLERAREELSPQDKIDFLTQVIAADPQRYSKTIEFCYLERAYTYEEMGRLEEAEDDYEALIALAPPLVQADLYQLEAAFFARTGREAEQQMAQSRARSSYERIGGRKTDRFEDLAVDRSGNFVSIEQMDPPLKSSGVADISRPEIPEKESFTVGGELAGREILSRPSFDVQPPGPGTVVMNVCVDYTGVVVAADMLQSSYAPPEQSVIDQLRENLREWRFAEVDGPFQQCGRITFRLGAEASGLPLPAVNFTTAGRGLTYAGGASVRDFPEKGATLAGLNPGAVQTIQAALGPDAYFDRINTSGQDYLSFGLDNWSLGAGSAPGSLPGFLFHLKALFPEVFEMYFGRYALDLQRGATLQRGYLTLDGLPVNSAVGKEQFRSAEWAYVFWEAAQDPRVQAAQLKHLLAQLERRVHETYILGFSLDQLVTSEFGMGFIMFDLLRQPAIVIPGMQEAVESMIGETKKLPADWTATEEKQLLDFYHESRKAGHSDNVMAVAPEAIPYDEPELQQMAARLSSERGSYKPISQLLPRRRDFPVSDQLSAAVRELPAEALKNFCLYLDAGHGGIDPEGNYTSAPYGMFDHPKANFHRGGTFFEGVWNREMTERIAGKLRKLGIPYLLTHHDYLDIPPKDRIATVNQWGQAFSGIFLLVQCNTSVSHQQRGFGLNSDPNSNQVIKSIVLARSLLKRVEDNLSEKVSIRRIQLELPDEVTLQQLSSDLIKNRIAVPAVHLRYLFYDNYEDANLLMSEEIQDAFAEATILGALEYLAGKE